MGYGDVQTGAREMTLREKAEDAYRRIGCLEKDLEALRDEFNKVRLQVNGPAPIPENIR